MLEFVVENRTGGNSTIGGLDVHRAAPDGYTVLFHASTHNVARLVMRDVPYDPLTGLHADCARRRSAAHPHHRQCAARENRQGHRRRQLKPDPMTGRSRPRNSARRPSRRSRIQSIHRPECSDRGLSRHSAGGKRCCRRTRADDDRGDPFAPAAGESRHRARRRRDQ